MQQIQQAFSSDLKCVQSELQRLQHGPHPTGVAQEQQGQQMKEMQDQMADVQRELQNLQHEPPPNNADVQREMQKMQKQIAQLHMKRAVDQLRETARPQFANLTSHVYDGATTN